MLHEKTLKFDEILLGWLLKFIFKRHYSDIEIIIDTMNSLRISCRSKNHFDGSNFGELGINESLRLQFAISFYQKLPLMRLVILFKIITEVETNFLFIFLFFILPEI